MRGKTLPKVYQIGAVPPPYGGVSIHLQRLMKRLIDDGIEAELLDISGKPKAIPNLRCQSWSRSFLYLLRAESGVVHFHNFTPRNLYFYSLLSIRHKTILSFHNERFLQEIEAYSSMEQAFFKRLLQNLHLIIVDSEANLERAMTLGLTNQQIQIVPEFIPPDEDSMSPELLPQSIHMLRKEHSVLLATNAFQLAFHNGEDMYGIDLIIDLTHRLAKDANLDVATVILLPNARKEGYFLELQHKIEEYDMRDRCLLITDPLEETSALWAIADVVIRAANTDGNSLSVLESLWCGTPVIASDCVERPKETLLFRNRDLEDLYNVAKLILSDPATYKSRLTNAPFDDNAAKLIALYRSL